MFNSITKMFSKKQNWETLEKGDKLYLLVPMNILDGNYVKYVYQESQVINVHKYENHINIRFKYSDVTGKRRRVELAVNKTKFDEINLSSNKKTSWAAKYNIEYGDIIVSYLSKESLNDIFKKIIENEIKKHEEKIELEKQFIRKLNEIQYQPII